MVVGDQRRRLLRVRQRLVVVDTAVVVVDVAVVVGQRLADRDHAANAAVSGRLPQVGDVDQLRVAAARYTARLGLLRPVVTVADRSG